MLKPLFNKFRGERYIKINGDPEGAPQWSAFLTSTKAMLAIPAVASHNPLQAHPE